MARTERMHPLLITSARIPRSLDTSQRTHRYVLTMALRVVCFVAGMFAPLPWSIALLLAAALLPAVGVLLANAVDHRTPPLPPEEDVTRPALTAGEVIPGEVEQEDRG